MGGGPRRVPPEWVGRNCLKLRLELLRRKFGGGLDPWGLGCILGDVLETPLWRMVMTDKTVLQLLPSFFQGGKLVPTKISTSEQNRRDMERREYDREIRNDMIREAKLDKNRDND